MAIAEESETDQATKAFEKSIGSGKDVGGSNDLKLITRQEIGNKRQRKSRRGRSA